MFIPDTGMAFVYRDLSQAEARIVAHLANSERLIELFDDPTRDVHTENARRIFGKSDINEEERFLAKRVIHASNYGMGPEKLMRVVNEDAAVTGVRIDFRKARDLIDKYFMLYPEIKEVFWKGVEKELRFTRTLNTPFGRKRMFFGRWDDKLLNEAYSYIPQSTIGDLCNKGVVRCFNEIEQTGEGQLLLQVHDSILMQCPIDQVQKVAHLMGEAMNNPFEMNGRQVIIPTDVKVGLNWGSQKEDNPYGLVKLSSWLTNHPTGQARL